MIGGKYKFLILYCYLFLPIGSRAEVLPLDDALRATYSACVGIDDELTDLKKMAEINTAVTGIGTGVGVGAVVVGTMKARQDKLREKLDKELQNIRTMSDVEFLQFLSDVGRFREYQKKSIEQDTYNLESKKLGNWRTGLMAVNSGTNVVGAVIANKNKANDNLQIQIERCKSSINNLEDSIIQARFEGQDITEANEIFNACKEYKHVDISSINKRADGAMISSVVGAITGVTGTVVSAVANTDKIRKDEDSKQGKKTNANWEQENELNIAANVFAGTSAVSSAVATVFNATQISIIKKTALIVAQCTKALK